MTSLGPQATDLSDNYHVKPCQDHDADSRMGQEDNGFRKYIVLGCAKTNMVPVIRTIRQTSEDRQLW